MNSSKVSVSLSTHHDIVYSYQRFRFHNKCVISQSLSYNIYTHNQPRLLYYYYDYLTANTGQ